MRLRSDPAHYGRIRIIGGRWRGRWLPVLAESDLRPTGNRIRETLFNWLMPVIDGARCLDLFAGTGALGFEAASRGAAEVVLIDQDARKVRHLQAMVQRFDAGNITVGQAETAAWLQQTARPFDIVFLDPPFRQGWVPHCCERLAASDWLAPGAMVYIEIEKEALMPQLPRDWSVRREKVAGQVRYLLVQTGAVDKGEP
ncbi:MAG: 16S rRNA (guanine(966)-N(2))-methyltransferase RsmD [Chromatiales bacterium]